MDRLISEQELLKHFNPREDWVVVQTIKTIPSAEPSGDVVSRGVFEQVMWERDVAIEQLKDLGYGLGKKPKTGHWIEGGYDDYKLVCSECGYPRYEYYEKPKAKYCECCGCRMIVPQERSDKE